MCRERVTTTTTAMKRMTKDKEHSAALGGGGGGDGETTPGLTMNFLDNFCSVFVSFVSRLNRKIRVPRVLVTVHVFCSAY